MKWEFLDREKHLLTPKFLPNLPRKSSKTERHGVQKRGKLKNFPRFYFLILVTHWYADLLYSLGSTLMDNLLKLLTMSTVITISIGDSPSLPTFAALQQNPIFHIIH